MASGRGTRPERREGPPQHGTTAAGTQDPIAGSTGIGWGGRKGLACVGRGRRFGRSEAEVVLEGRQLPTAARSEETIVADLDEAFG